MVSKNKDFGLVYKFDYPPYQIMMCRGDNCFIVCGGGGACRTGVPNRIELFELSEVSGLETESLPTVKIVSSFDRRERAIMSMRIHCDYVLTAEGSRVREYVLCEGGDRAGRGPGRQENEENEEIETGGVRERRRKASGEGQSEGRAAAGWELRLHRQIDDWFPGEDRAASETEQAAVSAVRYSDKSGHLIVAAAGNGSVRVYERYNDRRPMELVLQREFADISSAGLPVTEIDISPSQDEIVTVAGKPDWRYARVWSISRGVKVTELALVSPPGRHISFDGAYKFRHCRYARVFAARPSFVLYATHVPTANKRASSYMSVWGPLDPACGTDYQLIDVIGLGNNRAGLGSPGGKMIPTALCASPCGLLAAIGGNEGRVCVYRLDPESHRLALIYNLYQAHSFVVTDVTFLGSSRALRTGHQLELLSVGIDNMLRYHRLPHRPTYLRLERLYHLLSLLLVIFFCDRILVLLSLF